MNRNAMESGNWMRVVFWSVVCCCVILVPTSSLAQMSCESLKDVKLDHATVASATLQEAAPLKVPAETPIKLPEIMIPKHCEVKAVARPTSDSEINILLWLPPIDVWNGKFMQHGNGGWAGSIQSFVLIPLLARGYATSATDDGHVSKGPDPDASWAIGHPEKLIDFGHRAVHETAVLSRKIIELYYGKRSTPNYFFGCSDGGREALMEAERYPEDFNGIIAGAPANNWTRLMTGFVWNEVAINATPESKPNAAQVTALQKAATEACDSIDGVKDGSIQDPRQCRFDPQVLLCREGQSTDCLTQPNIDAVKKVLSGPRNPKTGEQIYPGFEIVNKDEWLGWIVRGEQAKYGNSFYSQAVYENPQWDWRTIDFDRDVKVADEKTAWILNSYYPDLRSFRAHGGKLIQYHGWGDGAIPPRDSIAFYEKVEDFLKQYPDPRSANSSDIRSFYRLFMVPNMGHCAGGPGAVNFGQNEVEQLVGKPGDAEHDILTALDNWVTKGNAPDAIIAKEATIRLGPPAATPPASITRPLCPYPSTARYKGHGDTNAAENFECTQQKSQ